MRKITKLRPRKVHILRSGTMRVIGLCGRRSSPNVIFSLFSQPRDFYGRLFLPDRYCKTCARIALWI